MDSELMFSEQKDAKFAKEELERGLS